MFVNGMQYRDISKRKTFHLQEIGMEYKKKKKKKKKRGGFKKGTRETIVYNVKIKTIKHFMK